MSVPALSIPMMPIWLLPAAVLLDLIVGDPQWMPHPVRLIGRLTALCDRLLNSAHRRGAETEGAHKTEEADAPAHAKGSAGRKLCGVLCVLLVLLVTGGVTLSLIVLADAVHPIAGLVLRLVLATYTLAAKSLAKAAMDVAKPLLAGDLAAARTAVSMIVGRDTDRLEEDGVAKAAIESVAESTADGVVSPLFYLMLFGPVGAMCFKAVSTMDSMIGYKSDLYRDFGCCAARLDDVLNFIPARIAALCMIAAAFLTGADANAAFRIWRRDRKRHASPNAGQTESACAGALSLQLNGDAFYGGVLMHKPALGDALKQAKAADIFQANRLMFVTAFLSLLLFFATALLLILLPGLLF